jgi:predicted transcriptional regulator
MKRTVTLEVASMAEVKARAHAAAAGKRQGERISFTSAQLLWRVLSEQRLPLLQAMTGAGELTIRELARRLGRDVRAVHKDVHALLNAGVIERTESGGIVFPYDEIRVNFVLKSAA